jgi:8-oxo-dGTP pyrophosphatase MutT (NUDIX family)
MYRGHHKKHFTTQSQCTNCGQFGHILRNCLAPITSYGIIAIRKVVSTGETFDQRFCSSRSLITGIENQNDIQFLLIQRRDSLSFIEFIRGKYSLSNKEYLAKLFTAMTKDEHMRIRTLSFEHLWKSVWGATSLTHRSDYDHSETRFNELRGEDGKGIERYIAEHPTQWTEPEWGFPKGRRNPRESDIQCAIREFHEETNIERSKYQLISNIKPMHETFLGSNHVHYCHKYYIALCAHDLHVALNHDNPHMTREIGDIRWLSLEEALQKIRPDSVEKREVLLKAGRILRNYCPVPHYSMRHGSE